MIPAGREAARSIAESAEQSAAGFLAPIDRLTRVLRVGRGPMTIDPRTPRPLLAALLLGTIAVSAQQGSRVSGRVVASDGRKLLSAAIMLTGVDEVSPTIPAEDVTIMPDGRFTFGRVPPGRYQVRARAQTQANGPALFATFGLVVETRDIANVTMTLQSGALLDGHVSIESRRRNVTAPPLTSLTIRAPLDRWQRIR